MLFVLLSTALAAPEMIPVEVWEQIKTATPAGADFEIPLRDGGTFQMADHRGKKVVLSFWASWCAPCRRELPALSKWTKEHPEVVILAVNVDRASKDAEPFMKSVQFDVPVAFDPDATHLGQYGVTSMPTMFLFDEKGQLAFRKTGFSEEKGFAELDAAIGGAK
ncbi:MAG: TlpA disulfide reductase family protein [Pseudomonadota bacterium]|nr:TlpA disulfide reductase family protein [Pseudomonadota bacterium]